MLYSLAWDWSCKTVVAAGEKHAMARVFSYDPRDPNRPMKVAGTIRDEQESAFYAAAVTTEGDLAAFGRADGSVLVADLKSRGV